MILDSSYAGSRILAQLYALLGPLLPSLTVPYVDLSGRMAIVTGSNTGIGLETAKHLAAMGASVVLACRNLEKAEAARLVILAAVRERAKTHGDAQEGGSEADVRVEQLDLGDAASVRAFIQRWQKQSGSKTIDILVNNAGTGLKAYEYAPNASQNYERGYYINVLGPIQLTLSLLPHFAINARVVNVASGASYQMRDRNWIDPSDLAWNTHIEGAIEQGGWAISPGGDIPVPQGMQLYYRVKFMQVVFTKEFQKYLDMHPELKVKNIGVYACNPGISWTGLYTSSDGGFGGELTDGEKRMLRIVKALSRKLSAPVLANQYEAA
ncbi:NAD(P)-binding protein [Clavulina sp. PMI_390]|nr:NAD(P)-binding protein [Clavulina sp. PMI_390]